MKELDLSTLVPDKMPVDAFVLPILTGMLKSGICSLVAELPLEKGVDVPWQLTLRATGKTRCVLTMPRFAFRPVIAHMACLAGASPYAGQANFTIAYPHDGQTRPHRFSFFICNEPTMDIWVRLYLYSIDGVWPSPPETGYSLKNPPGECTQED